MESFRRLFTYSFDLGGRIIKWAASSHRAFNASDTWCFLIGSAPDEASLRLLRLFAVYIMGVPPFISTISFLADLRERETVALSFTSRPVYVSCRIAVYGFVTSRRTICQ